MVTADVSSIEASLTELREGAKRWIALSPAAKAALLERVRLAVYAEAHAWATAASRAKGLEGSPLAGEEWISGPWALLYALPRYIASLRDIAEIGTPRLASSRVRQRNDGQTVVDVFPNSLYDHLLLTGVRAEVWMQPGVTPQNLSQSMAGWYKQKSHEPRVALVLGAGNIASIAPLDVLYKLIADGAVCILKMNPVNDYLGPIFERALKPLVDEGYLRFAYGGPDVGKLLTAHELVDEIHITGSDKTHDRIVFGDGPDVEERKRRNDPVLKKPITSELGNVSPTIVVPGRWSDSDFRFQAEHIVTQKMHNGGFNCIASQVLILSSEWDGTPKLIAQIENVMREIADRPAYYPGAADRCQLQSTSDAKRFGKSGDGFTPRTVLRVEARPESQNFAVEAFASVLIVTTLDGDTATFLNNAVDFANHYLWGTLGGNIIVSPTTMRDFSSELDRAIANMRYGCVGVNAWTGVGFLLTETTWGAFPGHAIGDIRSGVGVVHNSYLFDKAQKSVVYAPFRPLVKPPWFVTNKRADKTGMALVDFEMRNSPLRAMRVALQAVRG